MRALVVILVVGFGCGGDAIAHHAVRGTVSGLENDLVTLLVDDQPAAMLGNGAFTLRDAIVDGSAYFLAIGPISGRHACAFTSPAELSGVANADLVVTVACSSADTRLSHLDVSAAPLVQTDILNTTEFLTGPVVVTPEFPNGVSTTIRARAVDPAATLTLQGVPLPQDAPSQPIELSALVTQLTLSVALPNGVVTDMHIFIPGVNDLRLADPVAGGTRRFGTAIAAARNGSVMAIGAPGDGDGSVVLFARHGETWHVQQVVRPIACSGCGFGASVGVSDDGLLLAVGAPQEDSASGAVYLFTLDTNIAVPVWNQSDRLAPTTPHPGAGFGTSLALGVASQRLVVGAPGDADGAGAAFVFTHPPEWKLTQELAAVPAEPGARFGTSVGIDGVTIAIGAPGASNDAGAAFVFVDTNPIYAPQSRVMASNARAGAHFGHALALSTLTLVVGSPDESSAALTTSPDTSMPGAGAAYVFQQDEHDVTRWNEVVYLKDPQPVASVHFGAAVAFASSEVVVGEPGDSVVADRSGAIIAFEPYSWTAHAPRRITMPGPGQELGASVVVIGRFVAAGAPGDRANAGAAYTF